MASSPFANHALKVEGATFTNIAVGSCALFHAWSISDIVSCRNDVLSTPAFRTPIFVDPRLTTTRSFEQIMSWFRNVLMQLACQNSKGSGGQGRRPRRDFMPLPGRYQAPALHQLTFELGFVMLKGCQDILSQVTGIPLFPKLFNDP